MASPFVSPWPLRVGRIVRYTPHPVDEWGCHLIFLTVSYTHNYARFCQGSCNFFRLRLFCPGKTLQTAEGAFVNVCLCVFCRSEGISWSALLYRDSYNVTTPCPVLLIKWHGKVSCRLVLLALSVFSLQRCVLTSLTRVATIGLMQGWFPDLNELFNC